ncbi:MAG: tetratricopeptide repeat protein [Bacteroidota bacterium]
MSTSLPRLFSIVLIVLFFAACSNNKVVVEDTDPVLLSDPALRELTERIKSNPGKANLYYERGIALHNKQLDTLAIKDYKKAAALDTNEAQYYSAVGDLLFENKDINGSIVWIEKAIAKNPTDRKAHLKIAKLFLYLKEYGKAFSEINIVLRKNVYDPEGYFLKAMVYKDMKDTAKAISNFLTAVQVAPDYREAMVQLGLMYSAKNDPIALKYLDNAWRLDTTDAFPIFAKGVHYQQAKDYARAKEEYRRCILRNRQYAQAYYNMGYILMQEDSTPKAWRQYDLVTKIDPLDPVAYYNRGLCSELMDSLGKAVADYKHSLTLDPTYKNPADALKRLGVQKGR